MFGIDNKDLKKLEKDLKQMASRALPFATKATLNKTAFDTRKIALDQIKGKMITRNRFTAQSIRVDIAKTLNISRQEAVIGSTADYMETQEFGGTKRAQGAKSVAIATNASSGEAKSSGPRRKLPRRANLLKNIRLRRRLAGGTTRKQRNRILVAEAAKAGGAGRFIHLDLGRRSGIFKVTGGKRKPKLTMLWDTGRKVVRIPKNPWLAPSVKRGEKQLARNYRKALEFQIKRLDLFRR